MGPLLFILYVNDLVDVTNSRYCSSFLFADDVFLLFRGNRRFSDVLESNINSCLERVNQWTELNSLAVNSSKTKAIMFGPTNRFFLDLDIFLGDDHVQFVDHHKCLGVVLDKKLSFKNHIDALSGRIWGSLRRFYRTNIFMPLCVRKKLAHSILMSQVLYGFEVISGTIGVNLTRLKRLVNTITRFVFNTRRRDHISGFVKRFLGCSFKCFVKYRNLLMFHKVMKCGKPSALCRAFIFSAFNRNPHFVSPRIFRSAFSRSFIVRVTGYWNKLPLELRIFSHSNNVFRLKLLKHFYSLD